MMFFNFLFKNTRNLINLLHNQVYSANATEFCHFQWAVAPGSRRQTLTNELSIKLSITCS